MHIILSDSLADIEPIIIPIVPTNTKITANGGAETIETIERNLRLIKSKKLKQIEWSSIFPVNKNYDFTARGSLSNGHLYIAFLDIMKSYKLPIRVIFTTKYYVPVLNMLASIDEFNYTYDKAGDINYSIKLTEFYGKLNSISARIQTAQRVTAHINEKTAVAETLRHFGLIP